VFRVFWFAGVCRHGILLKAANMIKSGERYGFGHMLYTTDFAPNKGVQLVYYDVICKVTFLMFLFVRGSQVVG
jgi:hypothetical protein